MPIASPVGLLSTLDEIVAESRRDQGAKLEERFKAPVFIVVAPAEGWANITEVKGTEAPGASVSMLPTLVVPFDRGRTQPLGQKLVIGRSPNCDIALPFSALSKLHAHLTTKDSGWIIEDAGSRNGTVVNGERNPPGYPAELRDGAMLRFGDVTCKFLRPESFRADVRRRIAL